MNCPRCSTPLAANARFCGVCGLSLPAQPAGAPSSNPASANPGATQRGPNFAQANAGDTQLASWPAEQPAPIRSGQNTSAADWSGNPQGGQPSSFQAPPAVSPPQQAWPPNAHPNYPATMAATAAPPETRRPRRRRRIWLRILLSLFITLAVLAGSWIIAVRPYLHNMAQTQLNQALQDAESQVTLLQFALPPGPHTLVATESGINTYLALHDTSTLQNLQMTVSTTNVELTFKVYGIDCAVLGKPIVSGGNLQVSNVQVQGLLGLIMSDNELTSDLNTQFQSFSQQLNRTINTVTLKDHEIDLQIS